MKVIGLTGGIASGKSTLAGLLRRHGVRVIDADLLAREVVAPGTPGLQAVAARFGTLTADGKLDRTALGALVFAHPGARADLNSIVHPLVAQAAASAMQEARDEGRDIVVYEAPLLFENDLDAWMDATILVTVQPSVQLARLMGRDGFSRDAALARIAAQMPQEEKRRRATYVIDNDGSTADAARALRFVWHEVSGVDVPLSP